MTKEEIQKEKELLFNVLKDGLLYGLQLKITDVDKFTFNGELCVLSKNWCRVNIADPVKRGKVKNPTIPLNYIYIKPYLFPLSSMTETQKEEYAHILVMSSNLAYSQLLGITVEDWLNKNHFDYRGLIEKGLAIDATDKNIY